MENIITELWYGQVIPWEQFVRDNETIKNLTARLGQAYDRVLAEMTDGQKKLMEDYHICEMELESENEKEAFVYGFCLGARLLAAVMHTQTGD